MKPFARINLSSASAFWHSCYCLQGATGDYEKGDAR